MKIFFIFPRETYERDKILNLVEILKIEYKNLVSHSLSLSPPFSFFCFFLFFVYFWTKMGGIWNGLYWKPEIENYFFHSFLLVAVILLFFNLLEEISEISNFFLKYILEQKKVILLTVIIGLISCNFSTYVMYGEFSVFFVLFHFLFLISVLIMFFNSIFFVSKEEEENLKYDKEV